MRRALAIAVLGALGCGSSRATTDARDSSILDAGFPAAPVLGAQIDRMGRPAIATALIAVLASEPTKSAQKDAYNRAADPATWRTTVLQPNVTIELELQNNLAVFDALDVGLSTPTPGCGSALLYAGPPGPASYRGAADLFADDQLYVDTGKSTCTVYLALEIEHASRGALPHATCGGRTLTYDAIDVLYSVLASGLDGLDRASDFRPRLGDGVAAHADVTSGFPFLGPPH